MHKKFIKKIGILLLALSLTSGMLFLPEVSVNFALSGLNLWFTKMIPTLFPFMVVSGILIRMDLVKPMCAPLQGLFSHLFGVSVNGIFCILIGFLCGFPMGAKVVADLYKKGEISFGEAEYLLSFCNNIGPIYFCGFVLVTLEVSNKLPFIFGMYGIPVLYGMAQFQLKKILKKRKVKTVNAISEVWCESNHVRCCEINTTPVSFLEAVDGAIVSGIENITKLGGYMIFFNLFNMLPRMFMQKGLFSAFSYETKVRITYFFSCFFEISNGVNLVKNKEPWLVLAMIPFGGLCCMAQTYSLIKDTPLSISKYGIHKVVVMLLTCGYYLLLSHYNLFITI
ncbi:MAG: hypothetical protein IJN54_05230 [Lachnospiraceae bacterium]|nr:hypothetical protein [Lachnospiraceae bacterium]